MQCTLAPCVPALGLHASSRPRAPAARSVRVFVCSFARWLSSRLGSARPAASFPTTTTTTTACVWYAARSLRPHHTRSVARSVPSARPSPARPGAIMRNTLLLAALLLLASPAAWAQHAPLGLNFGHNKAAASSIDADKAAWLAHASSYSAARATHAASTSSSASTSAAPAPAPAEDPDRASWRAHAASYRQAHHPVSAAASDAGGAADAAASSWRAHAKSYSNSQAHAAARASAASWRASASAASASKAAAASSKADAPHVEEHADDKPEEVREGTAAASATNKINVAQQVDDPATTVHPPPTAPLPVDPKETDAERIAWLSHAASISFGRAQASATAHAKSWEAHAASVKAERSKADKDEQATTVPAPPRVSSKRAY